MRLRFFQRKKEKKKEIELEPVRVTESAEPPEETDILLQEPVKVEKEKVDLDDDKARNDYLMRMHESILEARRQCEGIKFEYGQVTSYLKDIQLIDQAPEEEKQGLYGAANRIVELVKERQAFQRKKYKITNAQKRAIENFEPEVRKDIDKLKEYEEYQMKIKNDLRQLSSEKNLLLADKRDIIRRQKALKTIGKSLLAILIAMGTMLAALFFLFKVDITMIFIAVVAFAFVIAAIILNEARKNRIDMVITEKKCSRAVFLSNRVKIKYVNNVRTLDYMYGKYQVRNAVELDFVYGQYRQAKREWERQQRGTRQINEYSQILVQELGRLGVKDRDIWCTQASALVDSREMVEVRHDLNVRRQKLREQLDYNMGVMEECMEEMDKIREKKPEYAREVESILNQGVK